MEKFLLETQNQTLGLYWTSVSILTQKLNVFVHMKKNTKIGSKFINYKFQAII